MAKMLLLSLLTIVGLVLASLEDEGQDNALALIDDSSTTAATSSTRASSSTPTPSSTTTLIAVGSSIGSVATSLATVYLTASDTSTLTSLSATHSVSSSQFSSTVQSSQSYSTVLSSSTSPSAASSTTTETPSPSSGVSSGVYIGIGVGATLAILAIGIITYFLVKRHRQALKNKRYSEIQHGQSIVSAADSAGKFELQGDVGKTYGVVTTVEEKVEMQTGSNYHEMEGKDVSTTSARLQPMGERYELHEEYVPYQRNGDSDTSTLYEKNGSDGRWGGGPGGDSESRSESEMKKG